MNGKICPIMTQGFIVAYYEKNPCSGINMQVNHINLNIWPKCLKESCAMWKQVLLEATSAEQTGYCGLRGN